MATGSSDDNLVWTERAKPFVELLTESTLPIVVKMKIREKGREKRDSSAFLQKPLLLYRELKGFKVVARNVNNLEAVPTSKGGVALRETGSVIVIPVDYQGWFRRMDDSSVPVLNIANLARIMPMLFFSARKFPGFSLLDPLNKKDIMYEKLFFPAGVYRLISVFEDYVKYKSDRSVGTRRKLLRCLVCESENGIDVLIPFDVTGEFYVVEHKKPQAKALKADNNARAYTLKQLASLGAFTKPTVLKLLLGEHPNRPCGFTSIIKVVDLIKDWTVIASTLDGSRKLLELPVAPLPEFLKASNGKEELETGALRSEYAFMNSGAAEKYSREIKVRERIPIQTKNKLKELQKKGSESERISKSENRPRELRPIRRAVRSTMR